MEASLNSSMVSRLHEPETNRLQREVDNFTSRLEKQRRRNASLDEQVQQVKRAVSARRESLQRKLPSIKEEVKLQGRAKVLENTLDKEIRVLNKIHAKNRDLIEKVDVLRREKRAYVLMFKNLEDEIINCARTAEDLNQQYLEGTRIEENYKIKILELKTRAQDGQVDYEAKYSEIEGQLEFERKAQASAIREIASTAAVPPSKGKDDIVDTQTILKQLLDKWTNFCKKQKETIDKYKTDIRLLREAFAQIREATGINDIDEIVTAFIKSEEQIYAMYTYYNSLNTDLDHAEERHHQLLAEYTMLSEHRTAAETENAEVENTLVKELRQQQEQYKLNDQRLHMYSQEFSSIQEPFDQLMKSFESYGFMLSVAKREILDVGFSFDESNVGGFLAALEEHLLALAAQVSLEKGFGLPSVLPTQGTVNLRGVKELLAEVIGEKDDKLLDINNVSEFMPATLEELRRRSQAFIERKLQSDEL
jgi:chromosome segregation ATPase